MKIIDIKQLSHPQKEQTLSVNHLRFAGKEHYLYTWHGHFANFARQHIFCLWQTDVFETIKKHCQTNRAKICLSINVLRCGQRENHCLAHTFQTFGNRYMLVLARALGLSQQRLPLEWICLSNVVHLLWRKGTMPPSSATCSEGNIHCLEQTATSVKRMQNGQEFTNSQVKWLQRRLQEKVYPTNP